MIGNLMRSLKRAVVFQISRNAGRAEGVITNPGLDAGVGRAALNHAIGILLPHGVAGELAGLAGGGAEERPVRIPGDAGGGDIFVEVLIQIVMAGDLVLLTAFLVQAHPAAPALDKIIFHLHLEHGINARKAVNHDGDEAISQADERGFLGCGFAAPGVSDDRNASEQLPGTGVLPFFTTYFGPRTAWAGFTWMTWPSTSQSTSMRNAARCCFTVGGVNGFLRGAKCFSCRSLMTRAMWGGLNGG
jgi:hypothetical protein